MFILQRPQLPKTGWSMPEPAPNPDGEKLLNSAIIEQDYANLPGLSSIERDGPIESATSEPAPAPGIAGPTPVRCNSLQPNAT
ncbi:MAG TPA: hypothetical protein VN924_15595 [Bryobacteraceae bacterium]|nr:hypothetical protein [Bryobacteraceae bacterium]